jgi:lipopolysaccharide export system protein LptA
MGCNFDRSPPSLTSYGILLRCIIPIPHCLGELVAMVRNQKLMRDRQFLAMGLRRDRAVKLGALVAATALWLGGIAPALDHAVGRSSMAQAQSGGSITLDADVQEANAQTGVVTARGNVRVDYPGRQIKATAQQAQYFSKERRMVLTGNVLVTQAGSNSIRGEVVTYLIDEARFVALPKTSQQVRSVYVVPDSPAP